MKKYIVVLFVLPIISLLLYAGGKKYFPEGYRSWYHVKTLILEKGHPLYDAFGGIHHVYANEKAYKALVKGEKFPDGAVLVFDLMGVIKENNAVAEGKRKVLAYMKKDSKKFKETGGWEFQAFAGGDPSKPVVKNAKKECFNCHLSQKENDYVFSKWRE